MMFEDVVEMQRHRWTIKRANLICSQMRTWRPAVLAPNCKATLPTSYTQLQVAIATLYMASNWPRENMTANSFESGYRQKRSCRSKCTEFQGEQR